ncbi:MAG TPA: hypothetical protein VFH61_14850 [Thermoleophilia bacterium]|nr:hypothetical protein [Thermoleophilia bacterium]
MTRLELPRRCYECEYLHDEASAVDCAEAARLQREIAKAVFESEGRLARHGRNLPAGFTVTVYCPAFWLRGKSHG